MKTGRFASWFLVAGLLLVFGLSEAFAGSPFYLTVGRSFSNTESPEVRLDYRDASKPMLVRVIRPNSLERFLEGQFQVSRSYEEPVTELNPGYYFAKGLNKMASPLKVFRGMLDPGFRKSFKDTAFNNAIVEAGARSLVGTPEQLVLGPPAGFTTVRDYYVDLQYGGADAGDLGWWFGAKTWREDKYKVRTIPLDPLPDGIYLIQAVQGKTEAQCLMQVSSLSVQVKQSTEQLLVRVINRQSEPVGGASASYRDDRGKWIEIGQKTDASGELSFSKPKGLVLAGKLLVMVRTPDGRQAMADTDFLPVLSNGDAVYIVTDRPIFKPGDTFSYKGVVRTFEDGKLGMPNIAGKEARISLIRSDGKGTDLQATAPVTDFGSFSGSFGLDETMAPGLYRLVAEIADKPYGGEFRVRDYVKPTFYLELIERSPTIVPGEPFTIKFRTKRYSGGVPRDARYEVFLYRKKFEVPQWAVEAGGGLSSGSDYYGQVRSASALSEPKRLYS